MRKLYFGLVRELDWQQTYCVSSPLCPKPPHPLIYGAQKYHNDAIWNNVLGVGNQKHFCVRVQCERCAQNLQGTHLSFANGFDTPQKLNKADSLKLDAGVQVQWLHPFTVLHFQGHVKKLPLKRCPQAY